MNQTELFDIRMSDVSETSLLTLYCHALESQSSDPIMSDPKAVEIMSAVNQELSKSKNRLHRRMVEGKIDKKQVVHIAIREKEIRRVCNRVPQVLSRRGCGQHRVRAGFAFFAYRQRASAFL